MAAPDRFIDSIRAVIPAYSDPSILKQSPLCSAGAVNRVLLTGMHADAADRVAALRGIIRWCIGTLAPSIPEHPPGTYRPPSDPAWSDPAWWQYNILRHLIIDPLPPDEYFEGGGPVTTLIARLGLPGRSTFYTLKKKALKTLEASLVNLLSAARSADDNDDTEPWTGIRRDLLAAALMPLHHRKDQTVWNLIGIASVFHRAFPRYVLLDMAGKEGLRSWASALDELIARRCVIELNRGRDLVVPPRIRDYVNQRQAAEKQPRRHRMAAEYCRRAGLLPDRIRHLQFSGGQATACDLIEQHWSVLNTRCFPPEFNQLLDGFRPGDLDRERWLRVLVLKGSYMIRLGRLETARAVFSRHVHESTDPESRMLALLFLAHICSRIDPDAARRYYDTAREQIDAHPSFTQFLYSSLGRFHLTRGELKPAETALDRAMAAEAHPRLSFRSVLLFARVELHLLKGSFADAAACCSDLLNYADTEGDAHLIAQATGLRGRIALATGNPAMALQYLEQSEEMHRRRGNFSEVSRMLGEQAAIHADAGGTDYAIQLYGEALEWGDRAGIVTERRALLHLARIRLYIASENWPAARREWVTVQRLRHRAARDEMIRNELNELSRKIPWESPDDSIDDLTEILDSPVTRKILDHLQRHGRVDSASVRTAIGVGRTSAYLILDRLTRVGLLKRVGRGRATRYLQGPVQSFTENPPAARVGDHLHPDAELILNYVNEVGHIAAVTARRITGSSAASVKRRLSELVRSGRLKRIGRGRATRYTVPFETNTTRSSGPGHAEAPTPSISPPG